MKKSQYINSELSSPAYQIWPGKNNFFCKGKLMMGPNYKRAVISFFLIFGPEVLFVATTGVFFVEMPIIVVASVILCSCSLYFHFLVSTRDPGYIPKQIPPFAKGPFGAPTLTKAMINDNARACAIDRSFILVPVNGRHLKLKYCSTCKCHLGLILRPPRTSHCADCGLCIEKFDHHCPWVGNCIGKKNYRVYLSFLFTTSSLIVFNLIFSSLEISQRVKNIQNSQNDNDKIFSILVQDSGGTLFFLLYCFLVTNIQAMWFVFFLTVFHSFLITKNMTTHEYLKKMWKKPNYNPFTYFSFVRNIFSVVFGKRQCEHFDLMKPIDLNMDYYSICPSREGFVTIQRKPSFEKLNTEGRGSPIGFKDKLKKENSLDEILPGQI